jgi:hypothetical protein
MFYVKRFHHIPMVEQLELPSMLSYESIAIGDALSMEDCQVKMTVNHIVRVVFGERHSPSMLNNPLCRF